MSEQEKSDLKVSVVVPAYNEAENIPLLMEHFSQMFRGSGWKGEVILVDDGSSDSTSQKASECEEKYPFLEVVAHKTNRGLTQALMTGFKHARGDIYVFWPADMQYLPSDIPLLINKIDEGNDIVTGWKEGSYGLKRFVSAIYNWLCRKLFHIKVHDLNSVKAFKKEIVEEIPLRKDWHRYMVVLAKDKGYKVDEVKVKLHPRKFGKSKFGFWRIPIGFLDLLSVKFQLTIMRKPLLYFGSFGLGLTFLGVVTGAIALYLRLVRHEGFRPLLYLVILLMLMGVSLFALGLLAEAIAGLKEKIDRLDQNIFKRKRL